MNTNLKECTRCLNWKPLEEFRRQTATKSGYSYECSNCLKERIKVCNERRYEIKSRELIEKTRAWQAKNMDKVRLYNQRYREKKKLSAAAPISPNGETH